MRTSIIIDDDLINRALNISGFKTKSEVIKVAVEEFVEKHEQSEEEQTKNIFDLFGTNFIAEDYDYKAMRRSKYCDID